MNLAGGIHVDAQYNKLSESGETIYSGWLKAKVSKMEGNSLQIEFDKSQFL